ncbi:putative pentatricopeptide repeat-containing protein [Iris pallida]|uniref:Pentatricopeptide repeat-containing protein n=1 Tax=Iris pallida TaxID=29817 RepID=A0AAX6FJL7_IRIPA|nr:putative pentatricopeptide repeat-containing protein [Iris pallida]
MMVSSDHKRREKYHDDYLLYSEGFCASKKHRGHREEGSPKEKKDKVGERVAALQQLVSPFGKTDTASVLQEASGYIKFLHAQLQVLSAPYLRTGPESNMLERDHCSLRSRGLCLMPIASTIKIARSNGADLWAPAKASSKGL